MTIIFILILGSFVGQFLEQVMYVKSPVIFWLLGVLTGLLAYHLGRPE